MQQRKYNNARFWRRPIALSTTPPLPQRAIFQQGQCQDQAKPGQARTRVRPRPERNQRGIREESERNQGGIRKESERNQRACRGTLPIIAFIAARSHFGSSTHWCGPASWGQTSGHVDPADKNALQRLFRIAARRQVRLRRLWILCHTWPP